MVASADRLRQLVEALLVELCRDVDDAAHGVTSRRGAGQAARALNDALREAASTALRSAASVSSPASRWAQSAARTRRRSGRSGRPRRGGIRAVRVAAEFAHPGSHVDHAPRPQRDVISFTPAPSHAPPPRADRERSAASPPRSSAPRRSRRTRLGVGSGCGVRMPSCCIPGTGCAGRHGSAS